MVCSYNCSIVKLVVFFLNFFFHVRQNIDTHVLFLMWFWCVCFLKNAISMFLFCCQMEHWRAGVWPSPSHRQLCFDVFWCVFDVFLMCFWCDFLNFFLLSKRTLTYRCVTQPEPSATGMRVSFLGGDNSTNREGQTDNSVPGGHSRTCPRGIKRSIARKGK